MPALPAPPAAPMTVFTLTHFNSQGCVTATTHNDLDNIRDYCKFETTLSCSRVEHLIRGGSLHLGGGFWALAGPGIPGPEYMPKSAYMPAGGEN